MNRFGHIDLRVRDIDAAYLFYSRLLPALGYSRERRAEDSFSFQADDEHPQVTWFGVIADAQHTPNATRVAFWAESVAEVDRLADIVRTAGGANIEGPEDCPYSRVYYAVFFEDPDGNRLEIYHRQD